MKKLLAIILTILCIIPTMAVSFSASAKSVSTTNVSLYQFEEKNYVVKKSASQKKYKFDYSISNNKNNKNNKCVVASKKDSKNAMSLYIVGYNPSDGVKPVVFVYYKQGSKKVVVKKFAVKVTEYKLQNVNVEVGKSENITVKFPAKSNDIDFKIITSYGDSKKATVSLKKSQKGNNQYTLNGKISGATKGAVYLKESYFDGTKSLNLGKRLVCVFDINVYESKPNIKENAEISLYYCKAYNQFSGIDNIRTYNDDKYTEGENCFTFANSITSYLNEKVSGVKYQIVTEKSGIVGLYGNRIYSKSTGKTTATIYGVYPNGKIVNYGSLPVNVKKVSMAKVAQIKYENSECDIFDPFYEGNVTLSLSGVKTLNAKYTIENNFLNTYTKDFIFNPSDYKITYKCTNPSVASVSSNGIVTAKKVGSTKFTFTIKFSDGSTFKYGYETITVEK